MVSISEDASFESGFPDGRYNLFKFDLFDFAGLDRSKKHIFLVRIFEIVENIDGLAMNGEIIDDVDNGMDAAGVLDDAVYIK